MLTYGALCELAERHGVTITENVRAFVREVEEEDRRARDDARPLLAWEMQAEIDEAGHGWVVQIPTATLRRWRSIVAMSLAEESSQIAAFRKVVRNLEQAHTDDEGYDVSKGMMKRLSEIGLVRRVTSNIYEHTDFGLAVLNGDFTAQSGQRGTPEQILAERKLTCEAIDGAIAFGYQNTNPPPSDDHWLAPFWKIGRKQAELEQSGQRAGVAENDPYCPRCNGYGEETVMSNNGPDAEELTIACQHCGGEGSLAEAYKGVAKLLAEEQKKYLEACGKLWFERHGNARQGAVVAEEWKLARRMAELNRKLSEPEWHIESIREFQRELRELEDRALAAPTQQQEGGNA